MVDLEDILLHILVVYSKLKKLEQKYFLFFFLNKNTALISKKKSDNSSNVTHPLGLVKETFQQKDDCHVTMATL